MTTSGRSDLSIPKISNNSASQERVFILNSIVLDALVISVLKIFPSDSLYIKYVSTVPKHSSPLAAFSFAPLTFSRIHLIFVAEKYGSKISPVLSCMLFSRSSDLMLSQYCDVLLSCHTIAL